MPKIRIALLSGGTSGERNVSLQTGDQIFKALNKTKYNITRYDPKYDLVNFFVDAQKNKFDLVFPALHGPNGEDGRLQGMLDLIKVPYVFSGCLASALAMDKFKTKIIAKHAGLTVAEDIVLTRSSKPNLKNIAKKLSFPIVVKPIESGSSIGISIANNIKELASGIKQAFALDNKVMLEKFISGRELTVALFGNGDKTKALPVIEIIPNISKWFDHKAKYESGGSDEICPAKIPNQIKLAVQKYALDIYRAIGCKDIARADFIWSADSSKLYFLEINTIPGMTATSLLPKAAKAAGMKFENFLDKLISNTLISYHK